MRPARSSSAASARRSVTSCRPACGRTSRRRTTGRRCACTVNGVLSGSTSVSGSIRTSSGQLRIGGNSRGGRWFAGQIDEVRVYDRALSSAELQADAATPVAPPPADTQAPTAPNGLSIGAQSPTSITLSWNASSDNVGVTGYGHYRSGTLVGSGTENTHTYSGLACGTSYTLGVDAYDAAGNRSSVSSVTAATSPCADTSAPSAPTGLAVQGRTQTGITVGWTASSDNVGVTGYGRYRNGSLVSSGTGTSYTFSGLTCGTSYSLGIDAYDAAGNRSTRSSLTASTDACPAPPSSSLVGAYSFDAGTGSTLADASGLGNAGAISGATWTAAGRNGGALSFDGVDDLVTVADAGSLDLTTGMTLEAWVRPTAGGSWRTVVTKEQSRKPRLRPVLELRQRTAERHHLDRLQPDPGHRPRDERTGPLDVDAPGDDLRRRRAAAVCQRHPGR